MHKIATLLLLFFCYTTTAFSQEVVVDSLGFETFSYTEGDSTYTMKKYFMVFLNRGPNRDQAEEELMSLQAAHLAYMDSLAHLDIIHMAGPFGDDGEMRGISIYSVPTLEDAQRLASGDPMVQAQRLAVEVKPWWAAIGSKLR